MPPSFSDVLKMTLEKELQIRAWCDKCRRYRQLVTRTALHGIPPVLALNTGLEKSLDCKQLWAVPGWLPEEIGIHVEGGKVTCFEGENLRNLQRTRHQYAITTYQLVGMVAEISSGENEKPHLVSLVDSEYLHGLMRLPRDVGVNGTLAAISEIIPSEQSQWHLFNDFLVRQVSKEEALRLVLSWKMPVILTYQVKSARHAIDDGWKESLETSCLYFNGSMKYVVSLTAHLFP